jgi:CheY-like chemotaxis protein
MPRILVIDDDDCVRSLIRVMLERTGYDVAEADSGETGITLYHAHPTDLVISDIVLPGKDGVQTIFELWQEFPDIKVIAISGGNTPDQEMNLRCAELFGAMHTLSKPFRMPELLAMVTKVLGEHSLTPNAIAPQS